MNIVFVIVTARELFQYYIVFCVVAVAIVLFSAMTGRVDLVILHSFVSMGRPCKDLSRDRNTTGFRRRASLTALISP